MVYLNLLNYCKEVKKTEREDENDVHNSKHRMLHRGL
jgi:hypothetical protein